MDIHSARLLLKTRLMAAIVVLSNVLGNYSLTLGLRRVGRLLSFSPLAYLEAFINPWVALGITLLVLWLLSHMALLSWADLSYVLPVTSVGYVLAALAGRFFLHEQISVTRWAGIALIVAGVALVSRTHPRSNTAHAAAARAGAAR